MGYKSLFLLLRKADTDKKWGIQEKLPENRQFGIVQDSRKNSKSKVVVDFYKNENRLTPCLSQTYFYTKSDIPQRTVGTKVEGMNWSVSTNLEILQQDSIKNAQKASAFCAFSSMILDLVKKLIWKKQENLH